MFRRFLLQVRQFDWGFEAAIITLTVVGLLVQYSLSFSRTNGNSFFIHHAIVVGVGLVLSVVITMFDYRLLQAWRWVLYGGGIVCLLAVLVAGVTLRNTQGWIGVGAFQFQMVEIVKPILAIVLAAFWASRSLYASRWQDIAGSLFVAIIPIILVLRQPDFGSAALLAMIWFGFIFLVGLRARTLLLFGAAGIIGFVVAWMFLFKPYQQDRILTFLVPQRDPLGQGYQIQQSIVAVGSGKIVGRGFGFGPQSQQRFLPEAYTDFAFAAIAEEFGFIGVSLLFVGIGVMLYRLFILARRLRDDFGTLLVTGFVIIFTAQFWINIAMNVGFAPVVGIPFPFISYGGSSLLVSFMMVGVIQSMFIRSR